MIKLRKKFCEWKLAPSFSFCFSQGKTCTLQLREVLLFQQSVHVSLFCLAVTLCDKLSGRTFPKIFWEVSYFNKDSRYPIWMCGTHKNYITVTINDTATLSKWISPSNMSLFAELLSLVTNRALHSHHVCQMSAFPKNRLSTPHWGAHK